MLKLYEKPCRICGSINNYIFSNNRRQTIICEDCKHMEDIFVSDELKEKWAQEEIQKAHQNEVAQSSQPKCPICGSTSLSKIKASKRLFKTALFGLAGAVDDAGKTWQCNECKSKF